MREDLEKLTMLQELDLKIDKAKKASKNAPSVIANLESDFKKLEAVLASQTSTLQSLEKQRRDWLTENIMDTDRIKNIDSRLGEVTNNKEFHAVSKESDKAKKNISDREKMIAEVSAKVEAQAKVVEETQVKIDELKVQLDTKKAEISTMVGEADKEAASYSGDRSTMVSGINTGIMTRYNRLRTVYSDAISIANQGRCSSCNMALPPQMYIQVQKGLELLSCPSCSRLLYYKIQ